MGNEIWTDFRPDKNIHLVLERKGAHALLLGCRYGPVRGIHNRLAADGRFSDRVILYKVQFCSNAMLHHGGFSAYQMVPGSNPVDSYMRQDENCASNFVQDTPASGRFAQRRKLRTL